MLYKPGSHMSMPSYPTVTIGGLPIAVLDCEQTARLVIDTALAQRGKSAPCVCHTSANGQVISMCASDPTMRDLFKAFELINADGMPMVFASRYLTPYALPERVATTDMFHNTARLAEQTGASFYFLGASEEVNRKTVEEVQRLYPQLKIAGRQHGYFKSYEEREIVQAVNDAAPDVLWLAMGVPKEQQFALRNQDKLTRVGVLKTSGGLFDFLSGKNSRAPGWMQSAGLEWLYRTCLEPRRLFLRYFLTNPHALWVMLRRSGDSSA